MDAELEQFVREQKDRREILDCIMTYCRGIDRLDADLLRSVFHPGALDDHSIFVGPAEAFVDWVIDFHTTHQQRTMHLITTHRCELDGDTAHAETYYLYRALNREAPFHNNSIGRYIDRFEKRDGRWKIAARLCTVDIYDETWDPDGDLGDGVMVRTARDRSDPSYMRPLTIDPARFTV